MDSASVSERLETCNRDKEQGDERSTTLARARAGGWAGGRAGGRAGGHVTDGQRNEAKAARGVFAAMARRTRGGRGRASALTPNLWDSSGQGSSQKLMPALLVFAQCICRYF